MFSHRRGQHALNRLGRVIPSLANQLQESAILTFYAFAAKVVWPLPPVGPLAFTLPPPKGATSRYVAFDFWHAHCQSRVSCHS
jgi:hypothetical protein